MVNGGRYGWRCARWLLGLCASLGSAAGCGGRTAALDGNAYDPFSDDGGSGSGGKSGNGVGGASGARAGSTRGGVAGRAGSGGLSGAGTGVGASAPVGGSTLTPPIDGTGGTPSETEAERACREYCSGYSAVCAYDYVSCIQSCEPQLDSFHCQPDGIKSLDCATPYFSSQLGCPSARVTAREQCSGPLIAFQSCKGSPPSPPLPTFAAPDVASCSGIMTMEASSCKATFNCDDGDYTVSCSYGTMSMLASCSCTSPNGSVRTGTITMDGKPCYQGARDTCR